MRKSQLPYLIDLIDDTSEEVRTIVLKELNDYGLSLEEDLQTLSDSIDKDKVNLIRPIIEQNRRITFKANWKIWNQLHDELEQLEYVMQMVVYYQWGSDKASLLSGLIDKLADEFIALSPRRTEVELAEHLFLLYGITGAGDEYFNPFHLNLLYVAEEKKGIPVSLVILYILVGKRLGFKIEPILLPDNCFAKIKVKGETLFVDCFNFAEILKKNDLFYETTASRERVKGLLDKTTNMQMLIRRVISELTVAYKEQGDQVNRYFFDDLATSTLWHL